MWEINFGPGHSGHVLRSETALLNHDAEHVVHGIEPAGSREPGAGFRHEQRNVRRAHFEKADRLPHFVCVALPSLGEIERHSAAHRHKDRVVIDRGIGAIDQQGGRVLRLEERGQHA